MSSSAERGARGPSGRDGHRADAGFSLVELLVCLALLGVVAGAVVPQLITGIRTNDVAKVRTQAKGVAQAQTEKMRNLPYYVAPDAGDYIDVLDTYYRNLTPPTTAVSCGSTGRWTTPTTGWTGYVGTAGTRCAWEPARPFYRRVRVEGDFTVVTDTRFLTDTTPAVPVTPVTGYDSQTVGSSSPAASQIAVTVSVFPRRWTSDPVTTSTQLGRSDLSSTRLLGRVDVATVQAGTTSVDALPVTVSAGLVNLSGSLTTTSNTTATLSAALTGLGTGEQGGGASGTVTAPPATSTSPYTAAGAFLGTTCDLACWGGSRVSSLAASSTGGLPQAGSPASPGLVLLDSASNRGLSLRAGPGADWIDALDLVTAPGGNPLVRVDRGATLTNSGVATTCAAGPGAAGFRVAAGGWLRTTAPGAATDPFLVEACGVGVASEVSLLPTVSAPQGLIQVSLSRGRALCRVSGAAHTAAASYDYAATVSYFNGTGYTTVPVTSSSATDPLASIDLSSVAVGGGRVLGDYVASWSAATTGAVTRVQAGGVASVDVPGVVNIVTKPLRALGSDAPSPTSSPTTSPTSSPTGTATTSATASASTPPTATTSTSAAAPVEQPDPDSSVTLSLGTLSCHAMDAR